MTATKVTIRKEIRKALYPFFSPLKLIFLKISYKIKPPSMIYKTINNKTPKKYPIR